MVTFSTPSNNCPLTLPHEVQKASEIGPVVAKGKEQLTPHHHPLRSMESRTCLSLRYRPLNCVSC